MKCKTCNGTGIIGREHAIGIGEYPCYDCNGTGKVKDGRNTQSTCAGCGKTSKECGYNKEDKIEEDGSYDANSNQFVCDFCYTALIMNGMDIEPPKQLIQNIKALIRKIDDRLY